MRSRDAAGGLLLVATLTTTTSCRGFTNPLGDHGNVGFVATTEEDCEVEITGRVELGEFTYVGGETILHDRAG